MHDAFQKYKPSIPRRWLLLIAGMVWTAVSIVLCGRAAFWAAAVPPSQGIPLECAGVLIAAAGYWFGFSKIVERNAQRISALPARPCLFAFTPWRGYFVIGLMISMGITLRNSSLNKVYLIIPYLAMGGVLFLGSLGFYTRFFKTARQGS